MTFDPAIRIYDPIPGMPGYLEEGTGTIFNKHISGSFLQFDVVTAAHVLDASSIGITIGLESGDYNTNIVTPDATVVATGGPSGHVDLGFLSISIDLSKNAAIVGDAILATLIEDIQPVALAAAPATAGFSFTSTGYGLTAEQNSTGTNPQFTYIYDPTNSALGYGTERTFTNTISSYQNNFQITDGTTGKTYTSNVENFFLTSATGTGVSEPGDSGSGMIYNGTLQGIIEYGPAHQFNAGGTTYNAYQTGDTFGGVRLTSSYLSWLQTQDSTTALPEPTTWMLLLAPTAFLLIRKRHSAKG